jgi:hypothetical protein
LSIEDSRSYLSRSTPSAQQTLGEICTNHPRKPPCCPFGNPKRSFPMRQDVLSVWSVLSANYPPSAGPVFSALRRPGSCSEIPHQSRITCSVTPSSPLFQQPEPTSTPITSPIELPWIAPPSTRQIPALHRTTHRLRQAAVHAETLGQVRDIQAGRAERAPAMAWFF